MKKYLPLLLLIVLVACEKQPVTTPTIVANPELVANAVVAFKDNNISVTNFKAQPADNGVTVSFTTLYQKNIVRLEVLRGLTDNSLCSIFAQPVGGDSFSATTYTTRDKNDYQASEMYYMIKYTLATGDWGYTSVFKLQM